MNTVRLPESLRARIQEIARRKGLSISQVHRLALEQFCLQETEPQEQSRYEDVIGIFDGPTDLAVNASERFAEAMRAKYDRHSD